MMKKEANVLIPTAKGILLKKTKSIICIQAEGSYCEIFLIDGERYVISKNLSNIKALLPETTFFRVHSSVIVNLEHIKEIIGSRVILETGIEVLVAQRRKKEFLSKLKEKSLSL